MRQDQDKIRDVSKQAAETRLRQDFCYIASKITYISRHNYALQAINGIKNK